MIPPTTITPGWDYICYTDDPSVKSDVWRVLPLLDCCPGPIRPEIIAQKTGVCSETVTPSQMTNVQLARFPKIMTHMFMSDYALTISCDIMITPRCDLDEFVARHLHGEMTLMRHPSRNCIYEEAEACKRLRKDSHEIIDNWVSRLRAEGYPEQNGLVATGVMIKRRTENVAKFCWEWWKTLQEGSHRDQLSFNYVEWKHRLDYSTMPFGILRGEFWIRK